MGYAVTFIGLIHFHTQSPRSRLALLPDGRDPMGTLGKSIRSHHASIFVDADDVIENQTDWVPFTDEVFEGRGIRQFEIDVPSTVLFSGMENTRRTGRPSLVTGNFPEDDGGRLETAFFDQRMPRLTDIDRNFRIDLQQAQTIARIPLRLGTLEPRVFRRSMTARLEVSEYPTPLRIVASPLSIVAGQGVRRNKTLSLRDGSKIVVDNTSVRFGRALRDEESHFNLYRNLEGNRRDVLPDPGVGILRDVPDLEITNRYLEFLDSAGLFPNLRCSAMA